MSFVDGFYSFNLEINNIDQSMYTVARLKTPKHPYESHEHLFIRTIALAHAYEDGLEFSEGLYQPNQPTIWRKNIIGDLLTWVEVGLPPKKRLLQAIRQNTTSMFRVYFYEALQPEEFCSYLRGSKSNWIQSIQFFQVTSPAVADLVDQLQSHNNWAITFCDGSAFLNANEQEAVLQIETVDMWQLFQRSIANGAAI